MLDVILLVMVISLTISNYCVSSTEELEDEASSRKIAGQSGLNLVYLKAKRRTQRAPILIMPKM